MVDLLFKIPTKILLDSVWDQVYMKITFIMWRS